MLKFVKGNILDSSCEAIVIPVNCVGVMGKGLALQAKERYPEACLRYFYYCQQGLLFPGGVVADLRGNEGKFLLHVATKYHWRGKSNKEWITEGLQNLVTTAQTYGIKTLSIPSLGCGNGGLDKDWFHDQVVESGIGDKFLICTLYS